MFNEMNAFAGWADPTLTSRGELEALLAAQQLRTACPKGFDAVFCSHLERSALTAKLIATGLGVDPDSIQARWKLNEQMYGALTGLNKQTTRERYGEDNVQRCAAPDPTLDPRPRPRPRPHPRPRPRATPGGAEVGSTPLLRTLTVSTLSSRAGSRAAASPPETASSGSRPTPSSGVARRASRR